MVIPTPFADGASHDRGQLILIGAIAIAIILVGLVVVVNTAMFTGVVGTEGTVETSKEAGVAADELSRSVSAVVHRENVGAYDADENNVTDDVENHLNSRLRQGSLDGGGAFTSVAYQTSAETGTAFVQDSSGSFANDGSDWDPIPSVNDSDVGHLWMLIDVPESDGTMEVRVSGEDDDEILQINAGETDEVEIRYDGTTCTVPATDESVRIDVYAGIVYEERDCGFDLFQRLDSPYTVEFVDADQLDGKYAIVISNDDLLTDLAACTIGDIDCYEAIWSYDLEYTYDIDEVTHEGERRVMVYA